MHWYCTFSLLCLLGYLPRRAFWHNFCENLSIQTILQRELNICARSEARVCSLLISACTNLLIARASSHPLALKCLNWQSLHEFSLNTDINMCCSGLTCARARYQHPGDDGINDSSYSSIRHSHWTRMNGLSTFLFFHRCYCNVLGSQNAHPLTETYISRTLFVLRVIYNKPYYKCVVRFKLNRGPSACRTVCGEPFGSFFFREPCHPYNLHYHSKVWGL